MMIYGLCEENRLMFLYHMFQVLMQQELSQKLVMMLKISKWVIVLFLMEIYPVEFVVCVHLDESMIADKGKSGGFRQDHCGEDTVSLHIFQSSML